MYNNFNNNGTSSFGNSSQGMQASHNNQASQGYQSNTSQYQGYQKQYQPVGYVQSFYTQPVSSSTNQSFSQGYNQGSNQNQGYNQGYAATESFHMANYRGNQTGNDNYSRSDSSVSSHYQPSSFQSAYSTYNGMNNQSNTITSNQTQPATYSYSQPSITSHYTSSSQMNQQPTAQTYVSPNAYHTANYRGNQPGHDVYLRSDSSNPSAQSYSYQPSYAFQQSTQQGYQQQGQQGPQGQAGYQSYQQQNTQPYIQSISSTSMGQQYGNNSSY
ncbi:hypothetical protein [Paenibacillus anseongense]|uniref:hypothetical protein n=1 Tax=Paenibacillus TaxID=44249 RepID=UPI002DBC38F4|nr:hypothetical protein [Paenibacillus anseongense]MEC0268463.1 hypothetical protein [Paenibacillus anseongense]